MPGQYVSGVLVAGRGIAAVAISAADPECILTVRIARPLVTPHTPGGFGVSFRCCLLHQLDIGQFRRHREWIGRVGGPLGILGISNARSSGRENPSGWFG